MASYKICLVGSAGSGKSTLVKNWLGMTDSAKSADNGTEVYSVVLTTSQGPIEVELWDCQADGADQLHYVNADGFLALCDLTVLHSSLRQVQAVLDQTQSVAAAPVVLCGSKADRIDLADLTRRVDLAGRVLNGNGVKANTKVSVKASTKVSTKVLPISSRRSQDGHRAMTWLLSQLAGREIQIYSVVGQCC